MKRIAVYCGASKGKDPIYVKEAYELGKYMAEQGYELVFCRFCRYYGCNSRWCIRSRWTCYWCNA